MVENEKFQKLIHSLVSLYQIPSRPKIDSPINSKYDKMVIDKSEFFRSQLCNCLLLFLNLKFFNCKYLFI